jgi:hypothetical protein
MLWFYINKYLIFMLVLFCYIYVESILGLSFIFVYL